MYQNRIQTCSELPNDMLEKFNEELNLYDFILYHLFEADERYRNYYLNVCREGKRLTMLDNSAYEFFVKGEKLDIDAFLRCVVYLQPNIALLPDALMDKEKTLQGVSECLDKAKQCDLSKTEWMAVVQGNSKQEFIECINKYKELGIKNIAIPFHNTFLRDEMFHRGDPHMENSWRFKFGRINDDIRYALGRIQLIKELYGFLIGFDRIHFLGSHNPYEKKYLQEFLDSMPAFDKVAVSMDTGYPTKCGVAGELLFEEPEKPNLILDDFLNDDFSGNGLVKDRIVENVKRFRDL